MALVSGGVHRVALCCAAVVLSVAPARVPAQGANLEYAVKANFLYKFAPFVVWPPQAFAGDTVPFVICVAGADPFGGALDAATQGQRIGSHPIAIRRLPRLDGTGGCHVVFAGGSRVQSAAAMVQAVAHRPVLTVADDRQGASGSIIRFVVRGGRVRFIINRAAAGMAGITVSSKLLDLAIGVEN